MKKYVGEGSIITILDKESNEKETYKVVSWKKGEERELSCNSELGRVLVNKGEEGKTLRVKSKEQNKTDLTKGQMNTYEVEVLKIENPVERRHRVYEDVIQPVPFTEIEKRQRILEKRKIERFVHFTRLENLPTILKYGIWPRNTLDNYATFRYIVNDEERLDGKPYCTSLSVSSHNYKMLSSLRQRDPNSRWVLLLIDPQVLYDEKDGKERYLYCSQSNAAIGHGQTLMGNAKGFERIFEEQPLEQVNRISRAELGLRECEPTNPQAEVLISRKIEPKYIQGVVFESNQDVSWLDVACGGVDLLPSHVEIDEYNNFGDSWFGPRRDYKYWQREDGEFFEIDD